MLSVFNFMQTRRQTLKTKQDQDDTTHENKIYMQILLRKQQFQRATGVQSKGVLLFFSFLALSQKTYKSIGP